MELGHFAFRFGFCVDNETTDLGADDLSWAMSHEGSFIHKNEFCSYLDRKLEIGDVIKFMIDNKEGRLEVMVNGKNHGMVFEDTLFKSVRITPAVNIS